MYKQILIPVDGSSTSNHALHEAIKLANVHQSQLRIVHIVNESIPYSDFEGYIDIVALRDALTKAGKATLESAQNTARKNGIESESALLETAGRRIADLIVEEAKRWPADLIVMGTHGRHGFDRFFMGSVAEGVARIAPMPVLLIHGQYRTQPE